ncbi:putative zinc-binding protein [Marinobacterium arenosum]|uniref:putative zinc-binding protein n=1 Tax=Marinobacterium arenosum TaxID=2862496 RepID=UPI001C94525C|nr:putative zinc-binding protein [Marinobacterium arenosum]MBY4676380.1 putative zinc-binding protein [Marinobacterium arenosum]
MNATKRSERPLIYACSGCSNVAQLANDVALKLDHAGLAEMSCIAGVGGDVPALVRVAKSGRPMIGIDGCPLHCVANCLTRHGVEPDHHVRLYDYGLRKRNGLKADEEDLQRVVAEVEQLICRLSPA